MSADEYRIDITPAETRRGGYHVQVVELPAGTPLLTEPRTLPWRKTGMWCATRRGAYHRGVSEAYEAHDGYGAPLIIWHEGVKVIDETPGTHCPCCGHGTCILTGEEYGPACGCQGFCTGPKGDAYRAEHGTTGGAQ